MISVQNVTKQFRLTRRQKRELGGAHAGSTIDAVQDLTFTCSPGRIFTLLGPNGAGKTTMLRMIATMLRPTSGTVTVAGFDTLRQPVEVRRRVGFLTGNTGLYDRLTAEELVRYYGDLHSMDAAVYRRRRDELFSLLGIEEFASRRIGKLSTGMKQKVSIARTIIHDPEVVVFDEATAALDVIASRGIIQLIRSCKQQGKTVIFSTHRMGEVSLLSDDLAIIHRGRLIYSGSYADFQRQMQTSSVEDEFVRMVEAA
jgi:sodium transport system ATP-binding protein